MDSKSVRLAELLAETIFKWANKRVSETDDHRLITLEVFESVGLTIATVIGSTVSPENIKVAVPLIMQHINDIVTHGAAEASRLTLQARKQIAENARLEELWNKESGTNGKVS